MKRKYLLSKSDGWSVIFGEIARGSVREVGRCGTWNRKRGLARPPSKKKKEEEEIGSEYEEKSQRIRRRM